MDAAAAELDEEEEVEALQRDRLNGEKVDREHALRLLPQERPPGQARTLFGGTDPRLALRQPFDDRVAHQLRLRLTLAVQDHIIRIALEQHTWELPGKPQIER